MVAASTRHHLASLGGPVLAWTAPIDEASGARTLVEAYHLLVTFDRPDAHLLMAGPVADRGWFAALERELRMLFLPRTWVVADPTDDLPDAFAERADVVVTPAHVAAARHSATVLAAAIGELVAHVPREPAA